MARKLETGPHGFPVTIETQALAEIIGITGRRLNQLVTDLRIPVECRIGDSHWDTHRTIVEVFGYYRRLADHSKPSANVDLETQMLIEDLRKIKIANGKSTKELLPAKVYVQVWGELISSWKGRFIAFGAKMGPRVFRARDKVEAAEILDREVTEIFDALNDPAAMQEIETKIRDDDFDGKSDSSDPAAPSSGALPSAGS